MDESRAEGLRRLGELKEQVETLERELGLSMPAPLTGPNLDEQRAQMYRLIDEHGSDFLSVHAANGDYVFASGSAQRLFGWGSAEMVGRSAYHFFHPDDVEAISRDHAAQETGASHPIRYRFLCKDGSYRWVETRTAVERREGSVEYIVCVTRDVEDEVRALVHAETGRRMLERMERAALVGEMVGAFGHEINSPVGNALLLLDMIAEQGGKLVAPQVSEVRHAMMRVRDVVAEMAVLASGEQEQAQLVDLAECIARLEALFAWPAWARFEATLESAKVNFVEARLYQCVYNILMAHLYGSVAGERSEVIVRVTCRAEGECAVFEVHSPCDRPLAAARTDLLTLFRGSGTALTAVPLELAARIAQEHEGALETERTADGLRTRLALPMAEPK